MKRLKRIGQMILGSDLHFDFNSFSSKAMYIFVNMGATFVPIIKPIFVESIRHRKPLDCYLEQDPKVR